MLHCIPDFVKLRMSNMLFISPYRDGRFSFCAKRSSYGDWQSAVFTDRTSADDPALGQVVVAGSMNEGESFLWVAKKAGFLVITDPNFWVAMAGSRKKDGTFNDREVGMVNKDVLPAWYDLVAKRIA
jgi:hypothetical protein